MKVLILTATVWLVCAAYGFARIGDDEKKIEAVYGKAAKVLNEKENHRQVGYASNGFAIIVDFVNGISRREGFTKPDAARLTQEDIDQILSVSAAEGTTWKEDAGSAGDRKWSRSDNQAIAVFPGRQTFLFVQDPAYVQPEASP